jgi:outer membrane protein
MSIKSLSLYACLLTSLICTNANSTSLNDALIASYKNNPLIKSEIESLQSVDEEMPAAISGMLPSASSTLTRGKENVKTDTINSNDITDSKKIELIQPLFKGGRTYASIKKAKNRITAAREQFKSTEQQILFSAVESYMNVVSDKEAYDLAQNNTIVFKRQLEATQERFKHGEVTQTDVAQAKASLAKAQSSFISAESTLESSKATYEKVIGEEPHNDITMPNNPIAIYEKLDKLISVALTNNPAIKIAEYTLNESKNDISIQKSSLLPQLNAFANKQRNSGAITGSAITTTTDSNSFGLTLSIPVWL